MPLLRLSYIRRIFLPAPLKALWIPYPSPREGMGYQEQRRRYRVCRLQKGNQYLDFVRRDFQAIKSELDGGSRNPSDIIRDNQKVFKSKIAQPVEKLRNLNSNALSAEDMWFKQYHYQRALMQYLAANKIDVTKKVDYKTLQRGRNYAIQEALKATFADTSAIANGLNYLSRKNKAAQFIVEGNLPFKKTPVNILKRGIEYSPVGLTDTLLRKSIQLKQGKINAAEYIDSLASGLTGTGVVLLGMLLKSMGVLTGGLGNDKEDKFEELQGAQEYAIQIGDNSYTIDWLAPVVLPLLVGAEIEELRESSQEEEIPFSKMVEAVTNLSEPVVNMSMLQGINDSIENVKFSDNPLADFTINSIAGYVSQGVPTVLGQIARTIDDTRRRNYVEQGSAFPSVQLAAQRAKSKIPFALQTQQPYVDAWGREEYTGNWIERAMSNLLSPGYASQNQTSVMEQELRRIYNVTGNSDVLPSSAGKSVTNDGKKYVLNAGEYTGYQQTAGQSAYAMLSDLTASSEYASLTDEQKAEAISIVYSYAKDLAKGDFLESRGVGYSPSSERKRINEAQNNGLSVAQYLLYDLNTKDFAADKDKNGNTISGSKKEKIINYINGMNLTAEQKDWLYLSEGYAEKELRKQPWNRTKTSNNIDQLMKDVMGIG